MASSGTSLGGAVAPNVIAFIIRRLLLVPPLLLALSMLVFALIQLAPGDPTAVFLSEQSNDPATAERLRDRLGLNEPLPVQYWRWLSSVLRGDFGNSFLGPDVTQLIGPALWPTIKLQGSALLLSLTVSIPVGILSAIRQHSLFDNLATTGAFLGISLPDFWFALLLQLLFAVTLGWLPSSGMGAAEGAWSDWRFLILPTLILAMARMASFTRFMRTSMLDVLGQDYLTTARAKGLDQLNVIRRHALRNALIPMITAVGLALPRLLGGAVIVESVFAWPGLGKLAVDSVLRRDTPVILALVMLTGAFVLVVNLVVDVLYAVIDPRITS